MVQLTLCHDMMIEPLFESHEVESTLLLEIHGNRAFVSTNDDPEEFRQVEKGIHI